MLVLVLVPGAKVQNKKQTHQVRGDQRWVSQLKSLEVKYLMGLMEEDRSDNKIQEIKKQLNEVYNSRSKAKIDKMRGLEIQDHMYDIKKLQRGRKYEGQ